VGLWRPTIILPASFRRFDHGSVRAVLLHEVGHVRRRDDWTLLLEQLVKAIFFFNVPLFFVSKRLAFERELACDELAVSRISVTHYCSALLRVATETEAQLALPAGGTALTQRVSRLRHRHHARWSSDGVAVTALSCALLLVSWGALPFVARPPAAMHTRNGGASDTAVGNRAATIPPVDPGAATSLEAAAEHFVVGRSMIYAGNYTPAIEELTRSLALGYEPAASAYNISVAYRFLGDADAAERWAERADREPSSTYPNAPSEQSF
jgi:hypothetical protein